MIKFLDCTLRDGGYYNNWDFEENIVNEYLSSINSLKIDYVEIGFRTLKNKSFKGPFAFSKDNYLKRLSIPKGLKNKIAVMLNGSEIAEPKTQTSNLKKLFNLKSKSPVSLVRIACHAHEFKNCLPAAKWLKKKGYLVGFNLMQITSCPLKTINELSKKASSYPIDVLYFADSTGGLNPEFLPEIVKAFKVGWKGELGIHAHDNMGQAILNTKQAINSGVSWVDSTVTGMGRGPGNAQTEYLALSFKDRFKDEKNFIKLFKLIQKYFDPMKKIYNWGINPFYFIAGQKNIHPSYIQEMMQDNSYNEEDILGVIETLNLKGGNKFILDNLDMGQNSYLSDTKGSWQPKKIIKDKDVLILGSGSGLEKYKKDIEDFIKRKSPYVIALNAQSKINQKFINARAACRPTRLLADIDEHLRLPQPLITPLYSFPDNVKKKLMKKKNLLNFGISIKNNSFGFYKNYSKVPSSLVVAYALGIANSGKAKKIFLAGFDGYDFEDQRFKINEQIFKCYLNTKIAKPIISITPTKYKIPINSIFSY